MADEPTRPAAASQQRIRSARRLLRRKDRAATQTFLAEGPQAVREAVGFGAALEVFVSDHRAHADLLGTEIPIWSVSERDLAALTDTVSPQGVVAVCRFVDDPLDQVVRDTARLIVCCAAVRDPGNAGTVVRCADALGADGVVLTEESVDLYNAKTVRASVGSLFHLPVNVGAELGGVVARARTAGFQVLAADGSGDVEVPQLAADGVLARPTMWVFGNEAWGLPTEQLQLVDRVVRVPMYGQAESLNLATTAAICLYASATAQRSLAQRGVAQRGVVQRNPAGGTVSGS